MRLELETNHTVSEPLMAEDRLAESRQLLNAGIQAAQRGNRREARRLLLDVTGADPRNETAWLWLASISEYPEELLAFLKNVLEINPRNERAIQWDAATRSLLAKTLTQRGIDAASRGESGQALQSFEQALEYDNENAMAWLWMASLSESNDLKISYLEKVLSLDPNNETAAAAMRLARADATAKRLRDAKADAVAGNREKALNSVNELLEATPDLEDAWMLKSHLAEDFEEKISAYERVLEINPNNFAARAGLDSLLAIVETVAPNREQIQDSLREMQEENPQPEPAAFSSEVSYEPLDLTESESQMPVLDFSELAPASETEFREEAPEESEHTFDEPENLESYSALKDESQLIEALTNAQPDFAENNQLPLYLQDVDNTEPAADQYSENEAAASVESDQTVEAYDANGYVSYDQPAAGEASLSVHEFFDESVADPYEMTVSEADVQPNQDFNRMEESRVGSKTILVVDDNATIRKLLSGKLERCGFEVICAEDGPHALEILSHGVPDLVLLDSILPGVDGYEVCRQIRSSDAGRDLPVVMILEKDELLDESRAEAANGFLMKPFGPDTLMRTIDPLLAR